MPYRKYEVKLRIGIKSSGANGAFVDVNAAEKNA